jgi:hypothetical protein
VLLPSVEVTRVKLFPATTREEFVSPPSREYQQLQFVASAFVV